jgi:hypothetical protein
MLRFMKKNDGLTADGLNPKNSLAKFDVANGYA